MDSTSSDGWMRVQLDLAQIFNACQLKRKIDDDRIGFPDPAPITQVGSDVPYFILADDAFALKTWLMKPYGRRMLTREDSIANYRISRGRRVVENTFGILVSRFRVMLTTIELPPETMREVVFTCVVLHNILRSQYQGQHGGQQPDHDDDDDNQLCLFKISQPFPNRSHPHKKQTNLMPKRSHPPNKQTNPMPNICHQTNRQTNPMPNITCHME